MDVLAVREAVSYLKDQCIKGKGPFMLEGILNQFWIIF